MSNHLDSRSAHATRRLQLILLAMIAWDLLALAAELSFGGPLLKIDGDKLSGILAARASVGGAAVVTIVMYLYALVRGPVRHRGVLWAGVLELGAGALFAVYHVAAGDIKVEGMIVPLVVSAVLLVMLLLSMPRSPAVTSA
ncbi:MAG TPA: hypothetical protein VJB57_04950 [Dehalococcoidia bacterium]|nr:hypothetical protein [Dehalococcoidia bacterium]